MFLQIETKGAEMSNIKEISEMIKGLKSDNEVTRLLNELLTESELDTLSKRWRIVKMLNSGLTQREIAKELKVSLCKVTRGAKILKKPDSMVRKFLKQK